MSASVTDRMPDMCEAMGHDNEKTGYIAESKVSIFRCQRCDTYTVLVHERDYEPEE